MSFQSRVLVLDAHTNQALACIRSLGSAGCAVFVASHRRLPLGAWSRYSKGAFHLSDQSVESFARLREWARKRKINVVMPLTERSCVLCNAERAEWEAERIIVGCGPDVMLSLAFDKAKTIERAMLAGVTVPPTRLPQSLDEFREAARELGYPCVVKPRSSNAWNGRAFGSAQSPAYVDSAARLDEAALSRKQGELWPIIQGYVPGAGKGVFALCDRGKVVAWFAHERLRDVKPTGSGSSLRRSIRLEPRLKQPTAALLAEMQWHGPAMVEFRDDGAGAPYLMEVNGRFWGSLQLSVEAGVDFPRLWLSILTGEPVAPACDYLDGLTLRWLWGDVKRLLHILSGPPEGYPYPYPTLWAGLKELLGPQPAGTRLEVYTSSDPWPAVGEWVEGIRGLWERL